MYFAGIVYTAQPLLLHNSMGKNLVRRGKKTFREWGQNSGMHVMKNHTEILSFFVEIPCAPGLLFVLKNV